MSILDIITELGIDHREGGQHHHVSQGWVGIDCGWCRTTGDFHLGIALNGLGCRCWRCGPHSVAEALVTASGRSWGEIKRLLGGIARDDLPLQAKPRGKLVLPSVGPLLKPHRSYLKGRGFDHNELANVWGVGGIGLAAKHAWSIFIPITLRGETVSWTTRQLHDDGRRYHNAKAEEESFPAKHLLAGEELCGHTVAVCEGPFDAMRLGPGAVWTGGVVVTRQQVGRIAKFPRRVICFDNEPDAQRRARELCVGLAMFPGETINVQLDAADPGSASKHEAELFRKAWLR